MIDPNEPEATECPECYSSMTESLLVGDTYLTCDSCDHVIDLAHEYEADARADHLTGQIPNV